MTSTDSLGQAWESKNYYHGIWITYSRSGYAPLYSTFESFYTRNVYRRIKECFNNVIGSVPGATVTFIDRKTEDDCWTFEVMHDKRSECINVSSYNYLGYAQVSESNN